MSILHLDVTPVPAPVHLANELYQQINTNKPKRFEFLNSVQKAWHPPNSPQKKKIKPATTAKLKNDARLVSRKKVCYSENTFTHQEKRIS